jgi:hypothetical protein
MWSPRKQWNTRGVKSGQPLGAVALVLFDETFSKNYQNSYFTQHHTTRQTKSRRVSPAAFYES